MRVTDFLPARRPLRRRGRGVSLPGRCSGPFRPISTPGGRCCSSTELGPRTPAPLAHTRRSLAASWLQPAPGALSRRSTSPPSTRRPSTPLALGCRARGPAPFASPSLRTPRGGDTPRHTPTPAASAALRSPGAPPPFPSRASPVRPQLPCRGALLLSLSGIRATSCIAPFPVLPDSNGGCPST